MLSKSIKKMLEQIKDLSDTEIFRAYHKATMKGDFDLCLKIMQSLSPKKQAVLKSNHALFLCKFMALQMILINKASVAIEFYNSLLSTLLGISYPNSKYRKKFLAERLNELFLLRNKIREIDNNTDGVLELEEFAFTDIIETDFDYWTTFTNKIPKKEECLGKVQDDIDKVLNNS